jgi:hypothetical protein
MFSAFSLFPFLLSMFSNIEIYYCKAATGPSGLRRRSRPRLDALLYSASAQHTIQKQSATFFSPDVMLKSSCENFDRCSVVADCAPGFSLALDGSGFLPVGRPEWRGPFHRQRSQYSGSAPINGS